MEASSGTHRAGRGWSLVLAAAGVLGLSAVLVFAALAQTSSLEDRTLATRADAMMEARRALELATLKVVSLRMLDAIGHQGDRSERIAAAGERVRSATASISGIAQGTDSVAGEARILLDDADLDALDDPANGDLRQLFAVAEDYSRWSGVTGEVLNRRDAVHQLSFVQALPTHVMIEGIAADASVNERDIAPEAAAFFRHMTSVVRTEGGWFGDDSSTPLFGSEWIEIDDARELLPDGVARLTDLVAASDLIIYDTWMRLLGDTDAPPPFPLGEALSDAEMLEAVLADVIDELIADDAAQRLERINDANSRRHVLLLLAGVVALFALALTAIGAYRIRHSSKTAQARAALATTDALTGVGNRHDLEERVRALTLGDRFAHHLVAFVDLDDFKIVNDVYGHDAGDAVLIEVAAGLRHVATQLEELHEAAATSVTRLGGDEFMLTAHTFEPCDQADVRRRLDAVRSASIDVDGESVALGFSIGMVVGEGSQNLSDLMRAADLAVYEDKSRRGRTRRSAAAARGHQPVVQTSNTQSSHAE